MKEHCKFEIEKMKAQNFTILFLHLQQHLHDLDLINMDHLLQKQTDITQQCEMLLQQQIEQNCVSLSIDLL